MLSFSCARAAKRGTALSVAIMLLAFGLPVTARGQAAPSDSLDAFLRRSLVPLRSLSATDDDFSDLEPLARAIGPARIVQLGEQSHGAGATFEARVRLIKFLHQRMGFDVVVWESGMYETRSVNTAFRAGKDPSAAAAQGIFGIWSSSQEARPLFQYAQASIQTDRPLEMAGFDMQFSAGGAFERFRVGLQAFALAVPDAAVRDHAVRLATNATERYQRFTALATARMQKTRELTQAGTAQEVIAPALEQWRKENEPRLAPKPADLAQFIATVDSLRALIASARSSFLVAHASNEVAFHLQALHNFREFGQTEYERAMPGAPARGTPAGLTLQNAGWNRRDTQNARNMLWFAREYYAGRKMIVWAHSGHTMNAYYTADWSRLTHEPQPGGMSPTGAIIADSIGDQIYTLTIAAYQGKDGWVTTGTQTDVPPAPVGSLEERIHRAGHQFAFLNLRSLKGRPERSVLQGMGLRLRGYLLETFPDWTRVIDGVVYMDTARAATRWTPPRSE